jgi:hypothetical protein
MQFTHVKDGFFNAKHAVNPTVILLPVRKIGKENVI